MRGLCTPAAAADATKERDELQRSLDAARAEAVSSAAQLAAAVQRERSTTKAAEDNRKALAEARRAESAAADAAAKVQAELAPLREELTSVSTKFEMLQEQAASSIASASCAQEQVEKLLADKAAIHEELGTLKAGDVCAAFIRTRMYASVGGEWGAAGGPSVPDDAPRKLEKAKSKSATALQRVRPASPLS